MKWSPLLWLEDKIVDWMLAPKKAAYQIEMEVMMAQMQMEHIQRQRELLRILERELIKDPDAVVNPHLPNS
jgi:hypothetical protein